MMQPHTQSHPSYLELDVAALEGGARSERLRQHLRGCEHCAEHVRRVGEQRPLPAWARALETRPAGPPRFSWLRPGTWAGLGGLAAVGLATVLLVLTSRAPLPIAEGSYIGVKGAPAVTIFVKRGAQVAAWDGRGPVAPGDSVRLRVDAPGFRHVVVGTYAPSQVGPRFTRLYRGELGPSGAQLLPPSWKVDAQGDAEPLVVVVSQGDLPGSTLQQVLAETPQNADVWVTRLTLPKQPSQP